MRSRPSLRLAAGLALASLAAPARAQTPTDPGSARALFDEALKALDKGDWEGACPKFEASFALKPTVSALLNLAKCHDHAGKLTLAADTYQRARSLNEDTPGATRKKALAEYADKALRDLEPRIPRLKIIARGAAPDLRVIRDGVPVPPSALGVALPVDPGGHVVEAAAPGYRAETYRVVLTEGAQIEVEISLVPDPKPAPPPPIPPATTTAAPPPDAALPPPPASGAPAWAWATTVAGVVLGGAAIGFTADGARANCGGPCYDTKFTQTDIDALNGRRHRDLGLGLALGAAGAIGIAVGAWGLVARSPASAPAKPHARVVLHPWITPSRAGLGLAGGF